MAVQMQERERRRSSGARDRIGTGSVVALQQLGKKTLWRVTIVNTQHAAPEMGRISNECPIGEALLGRRAGDIVAVEVPSGTVHYRVVSVRA